MKSCTERGRVEACLLADGGGGGWGSWGGGGGVSRGGVGWYLGTRCVEIDLCRARRTGKGMVGFPVKTCPGVPVSLRPASDFALRERSRARRRNRRA